MPSDPRVQQALQALRRSIEAYRSVVVSARERARKLLAGAETSSVATRAQLELGRFGAARIDAALFAEVAKGAALDMQSRERLQRACVVLDELLASEDVAFVVDVAAGCVMGHEASHAMARLGRAFGAAHLIELVRSGRYDAARHDRFLQEYPFEWWSKEERSYAPPLVITVNGPSLRASALADLLDGGVRLVMIVRGVSSPAPLVRLVTPGTFVMQTDDPLELARIEGCAAPLVAALIESEGACFVHDPKRGPATWQRLTITRRPAAVARTTIGGVSPRQQQEELAQLDALGVQPKLPDTPVDAIGGSGGGDATERLTAWLLAESGLAKTN